ncbi:hypothetical protein ATE92_1876 [Ulvibacter sp. MAR_2010_11]|uniref:tetratricopeptide repeat protein n=1 Tax=Ulvibacter sp. MAR_2010_11 TaxID=1250229 RepID=UPI000C2C05BD|nr:hypothetical protein [Ulvibacter sp. MAR_2010_11]PKA83710.1 hypothetical protein ATE92_1876 [Ulvibacter sp. MAR_2010_11]
MKTFYTLLIFITLISCKDKKEEQLPLSGQPDMLSAPAYEAISLLGDTLYSATPSDSLVMRYNEKKVAYDANPNKIETIIWHGRFTAYLGKYNEAIAIYTKGIEQFPNDPRLYRHRGHRYITLRKFNRAIEDLTKAAQLIEGTKDEVEPDGMPNAQNIPVSTLHGNIYYHLGLAHYLNRSMGPALDAFKKCLETSNKPDNVVSATHWIYMINRRLGRDDAAKNYVKNITSSMEVIENTAYHRACLFYKGDLELKDINSENEASTASDTALRYAIANWLYYTGYAERARVVYNEIVSQDDWASFGYIAAENDLAKLY